MFVWNADFSSSSSIGVRQRRAAKTNEEEKEERRSKIGNRQSKEDEDVVYRKERTSEKRPKNRGTLNQPASSLLQSRDLRIVDPEFEVARDPAILTRRHCLVVNLPPVRAIILPDRCFFFPEDGVDADLAVALERFREHGIQYATRDNAEKKIIEDLESQLSQQKGKQMKKSSFKETVASTVLPQSGMPMKKRAQEENEEDSLDDSSEEQPAFGLFALETFLTSCLAAFARDYRDLEPIMERLTGGTGMPPPMLSSVARGVLDVTSNGENADENASRLANLPRWARRAAIQSSSMGYLERITATIRLLLPSSVSKLLGINEEKQLQKLVNTRSLRYLTSTHYSDATNTTMNVLSSEGVFTHRGVIPAPKTATFDALRSAKARIGDLLTRLKAIHRVLAELLDTSPDLKAVALTACVELQDRENIEWTHKCTLHKLLKSLSDQPKYEASVPSTDVRGTQSSESSATAVATPTVPLDKESSVKPKVVLGTVKQEKTPEDDDCPVEPRTVSIDPVRDAAEVLLEAYLAEVESITARAKLRYGFFACVCTFLFILT